MGLDDYISPDNPLVILIAAMALLCFAFRLAEQFIDACRGGGNVTVSRFMGVGAAFN